MRLQSELPETRRIRSARLLPGDGVTDPQNRPSTDLPSLKMRHEREGEPACRACISHQSCADFRNSIKRQTALQGDIQRIYAEGKTKLFYLGFFAFRVFGSLRLFCRGKGWQGFPLQSGDLCAQGKKSLLRRGVLGHGVSSIHICSLYVLRDSRGREKSQQKSLRNLFLFR